MQAIKKKLKRIIKLFITYKIENDTRVYQLKYTPFTVKKSLIKKTFQQYGNTSINTKRLYLIIIWDMDTDAIVSM